MYYPLKYKTIQELIGSIETDRVAITDGKGLYLQHGEIWSADLSQGNAQNWSAKLDEPALALKIKQLEANGDTANEAPLYLWADKAFLQSSFESVEKFADHLIKEGLAVVYDYTPAEAEPAAEPAAEQGVSGEGEE